MFDSLNRYVMNYALTVFTVIFTYCFDDSLTFFSVLKLFRFMISSIQINSNNYELMIFLYG